MEFLDNIYSTSPPEDPEKEAVCYTESAGPVPSTLRRRHARSLSEEVV